MSHYILQFFLLSIFITEGLVYQYYLPKLATFINNIQSRELVHMTDLGSYRVSNETWELSKHFNNVFKPSGIFSWKIIVAVFQFKIKYRKHLALSFSKCGLRFLYLQNWQRHYTHFKLFNKSKLSKYLLSCQFLRQETSRPLYKKLVKSHNSLFLYFLCHVFY